MPEDAESEERRRKAEERRRKILARGPRRLDKIQGRPTDPQEAPETDPQEIPETEARETTSEPVREREAATAPKEVPVAPLRKEEKREKAPRRSALTERTVAAVHVTQRSRILVAVGLALLQTMIEMHKMSPLTLLFLTEATFIAGSWFYFRLVPEAQAKQMGAILNEKKFKEGSGVQWKLGFLRALPGVSPWLDFLYDLRFCFRTIYADVAVFVVLVIVLRSLYTNESVATDTEL